jgi:hypothetical protein
LRFQSGGFSTITPMENGIYEFPLAEDDLRVYPVQSHGI